VTATTITAPVADVQGSTTRTNRHLLRTGIVAGLVASAATATTAALAHAAGVSLAVGGEAIPVLGFAQITFVMTLVGVAIAAVLSRKTQHPARTFVRTTVALTLVSFLPDVFADAAASTRLVLMLTHVVAAAIVVPALASRLSD
jgi:uncharacterized protein DUF6069